MDSGDSRNAMLFMCGLCLVVQSLLSEGCGGNNQGTTNLTGTEGTFPNKTGPPPLNTTCQWNITAPLGRVIKIEILSASFSVSQTCGEEYLKVFDGPSASSEQIANYSNCGSPSSHGGYYISSGQSLWVELKAVESFTWYSLNMKYQTMAAEECCMNTTLDAPQRPVEHNFSSPYWPHGFIRYSSCGWYIKAPKNHIVKLHIVSELMWSRGKVEVYDVEDSKLDLISRSFDDGGILYSKHQIVYVLLKTFGALMDEYSSKGLFVVYTAIFPGTVCSSSNREKQNLNIILKNSSGIIKTPGFPAGQYPQELFTKCVWKIIAPHGMIVKVDFSTIQLYEYDCVVVVDGINDATAVEIKSLCGLKVSSTVFSWGREVQIKGENLFGKGAGRGFFANYTFVFVASSGICNMSENTMIQLTGEGRSFFTPGYPTNPGKGSCSWNITVPDGMFVKLEFKGVECGKSYVEVFDGTNFSNKSLGTHCNKHAENVLYSAGNRLLVRFNNTDSSSNAGMLSSYSALSAIPANYACSKNVDSWADAIVLVGAENDFASYDFPLSYPNGAKCLWRIESPGDSIVQLTFHSFHLQHSDNCVADFVEIRQGRFSWTSSLIGRFCGSSVPGVIISNHSTVFVEFVSSLSGRYPGFRASALVLPNPAMGACKTQGVDNIIRLTNQTGRLFSPLFPLAYPKDMTCTWIVTVPEEHFVRLRMKSFELYTSCDGSYLEIRDGDSSSAKLLNQFCSREFDISVFTSSRYLWVRFKSLRSVAFDEAGFNAVFEAVKEVPASYSCTAENHNIKLTSDSGTLASYNYPLPSDDSIECLWIIRVATNKRIKLSFDTFHVSESNSDCEADYVEIRDGSFDTSELIGKYCGTDKPSTISSDNWDLRVVFKSSGKKAYAGFKATYETERTDKTIEILKIVGICVGVLSVLCSVVGACCKYCKSSRDQQVGQQTDETGITGIDNTGGQEETSKV